MPGVCRTVPSRCRQLESACKLHLVRRSVREHSSGVAFSVTAANKKNMLKFLIFALLLSLSLADTCTDNPCKTRKGTDGAQISFKSKKHDSCITRYVPEKRARGAVLIGNAVCGTECAASDDDKTDKCEEECTARKNMKGLRLHMFKDGECKEHCIPQRMAPRIIRRKMAQCGPCPNVEARGDN